MQLKKEKTRYKNKKITKKKDPRRKIQEERSKQKDPRKKIQEEKRFQKKDPRRKIQEKISKKKDPRKKMTTICLMARSTIWEVSGGGEVEMNTTNLEES